MAKNERDAEADKYEVRTWEDIARAWKEYVREVDPHFALPQSEIEELQEVKGIYKALLALKLKHPGEQLEVDDCDFLYREALLSVLGHLSRAAHVLKATVKQSAAGYRSWSRTGAYHAAFFAMQAVTRLLGALILHDASTNATYQFDLWCPAHKRRGIELSQRQHFVIKGSCRRSRGKLTHVDYWSIFGRLLNATRMPPEIWPYAIVNPIREVTRDQYGELRNRINYSAAFWPYDDLTSPLPAEDVVELCRAAKSEKWHVEPMHGRFPMCLGIQLVALGLTLAKAVADESENIAAELESLTEYLSEVELTPVMVLGEV